MEEFKRFTIQNYLSQSDLREELIKDVRLGLSASQKFLLPKYFYDPVGSALFEEITQLPEYYPTTIEWSLLRSVVPQIIEKLEPGEIVELGSGSSTKTKLLLDAFTRTDKPTTYIPFDVSLEAIKQAGNSLLVEFPTLNIHGIVGDFERHLDKLPLRKGRRLILFLGSTIGNFDSSGRHSFLMQVRHQMRPGDRLLLGVDLQKDVKQLESAYNDSQGVTAKFNKNVLHVVNQHLHADFDVQEYNHLAFYNQKEARIEMHLIPNKPQVIKVKDLDLVTHITQHETIWTESSYKFTRESVDVFLKPVGLHLEGWFSDQENLFGLALACLI